MRLLGDDDRSHLRLVMALVSAATIGCWCHCDTKPLYTGAHRSVTEESSAPNHDQKSCDQEVEFLDAALIEVSLGIVFDPLTEFHAHILAAFGQSSRTITQRRLTNCHSYATPGVQNSLTPIPIGDWFRLPRVWFVHRNKSLLLQLQADRLYLNWLKQPEGHFPRFSGLFPQFKATSMNGRSFVESTV